MAEQQACFHASKKKAGLGLFEHPVKKALGNFTITSFGSCHHAIPESASFVDRWYKSACLDAVRNLIAMVFQIGAKASGYQGHKL